VEGRDQRSLERRIAALARVYTSVLRPERLEQSLFEPEYTMSPRQARDMLWHALRRSHVEEIGMTATARVVRAATRDYLVRRHALRALASGAGPLLLLAHGIRTGLLLWALVYLSTRPLAWMNRGRGARVAERILRRSHEPAAPVVRTRRALGRSLGSIPAGALCSALWGRDITAVLPDDEAVRDIAVKLADQYQGSVDDLLETSRALAR